MLIFITLEQVEVERIRPFSRAMYLKMAECYNNKSATSNDVQRCMNDASAPAEQVQKIVTHEMNQFQQRLQRCIMDCKDEVTDKYPNLDNNNQATAQAMFDRGVVKCADKHIGMIKSLKSTLDQKIDAIIKN